MRPWARAHGNDLIAEVREGTVTGFNEAVGSCPRKRTRCVEVDARTALQ